MRICIKRRKNEHNYNEQERIERISRASKPKKKKRKKFAQSSVTIFQYKFAEFRVDRAAPCHRMNSLLDWITLPRAGEAFSMNPLATVRLCTRQISIRLSQSRFRLFRIKSDIRSLRIYPRSTSIREFLSEILYESDLCFIAPNLLSNRKNDKEGYLLSKGCGQSQIQGTRKGMRRSVDRISWNQCDKPSSTVVASYRFYARAIL